MKYFKMGEEVMVTATLYPMYIDGERKWLREVIPERKAFCVGYTYKQEGILTTDPGGGQSYLRNIKSIKLLRVKFADWMNDKFALLQDVRRI